MIDVATGGASDQAPPAMDVTTTAEGPDKARQHSWDGGFVQSVTSSMVL